MTNLKDKLSASVRQAKASQQPDTSAPAEAVVQTPESTPVAAEKSTRPATRRAPAKTAPAARAPRAGKSAGKAMSAVEPAPRAPRRVTAKPAAVVPGEVAPSGSQLFPSRVWPD